MNRLLAILLLTPCLCAQTATHGLTASGGSTWDLSEAGATLPIKAGTTPPAALGSASVLPTIEASAGMTDHANGDYRLAAGSLYKGFATDGGDPGANQDIVEWATETAESGAVNPYLDMRVRGFAPAAGGGEFRFTAYSTAACSWQISSTRAFGDSLGSVSQTRVGRDGVATVSGVSAGRRWYRFTCDGRYREGEVVIR